MAETKWIFNFDRLVSQKSTEMPRKKAANVELQEKSREKILMAAFELFAGKSYADTTVDSIAKKAKVSKGLIYHYFDSKQDMLRGIFNMIAREGEAFMEKSKSLPPEEFCRLMVDYSFDFIINKTKVSRLITGLTIQPNVVESLRKEIDHVREKWMRQMFDTFEALGYENPKAEAYLFGSVFDGVGIGYLALGKDYPVDEVKTLILKRYNLENINPVYQ